MSDASQLTCKFRVAGTHNLRAEPERGIKRQRQTLTCRRCQTSKLRCDKARPCGSCIRHDGGASCSYVNLPHGSSKSPTEDRLARLETMVSQLLQASSGPGSLPKSMVPPESLGNHVRVDDGIGVGTSKVRYPTVVEEIMGNLHQLRLELQNTDDQSELETSTVNGQYIDDECIFGLPTSYSKSTILSQFMPPAKDADQLLETYFGGETFIQPFIHAQLFQRQYCDFKAGQFLPAPPLWLSTLFSIFSISSMVSGGLNPDCDASAQSSLFQTAAGQCLVLGRYYDTQRDAPEALLLYAHCKSMRSLDPIRECGTLIAIAVRHAYQLGYHRDPDIFGKYTVFEGEMRRRFWACCKQIDTMVSFQLGLPSNILLEHCDTRSPLNLLDSDFDVDTRILPSPRPETEATPILWFIVKDRLMPVFARICRIAWSLRTMTESEIAEIDDEVQRAYATVPDILRWRPLTSSTADPPFLIMCRLFLELLYRKSLCIIHRKHLEHGNAYSIRQRLDAATSIIRIVAEVHREFQPGRILRAVRWMFKDIAMTDFHLGATVLCLYLNLRRRQTISQPSTSQVTTEEVVQLLRQAQAICIEKSASSADARKITRAIQFTLGS
ncbi:hypothetical protein IQ07DRAFT_470356, partial [Pyrenochaeta sp. DS3sAY3a]